MSERGDGLALLNDVLRGRASRRALLRRAAALGLGAPAVATLLGAMPGLTRASRQDGGCSGAPVRAAAGRCFPGKRPSR